MNTVNNLRFQETDRRIKDTMLSLMQQKDFHKITVSDICKESGVNRSTFYAHFTDVYDLMKKMQQDTFRDIQDTFKDTHAGNYAEYFSESSLTRVLTHIKKNRLFYRACLSYGQAATDMAKDELFIRYMRPFFLSLGFSETDADERRMQYYFRFFFAGMIEVIRLWVESDCIETPEEMAAVILKSAATSNKLSLALSLSKENTPS